MRAGEVVQLSPEAQLATEVARGERDDVARDVAREALRPVVREAITEDVMRAVADLIALTPRVVEAIDEDLRSDDVVIRQRAYSLVAKYTIGHPAIVRPPEETAGKQLIVNFGLPRPDSVEVQVVEAEASPEEFYECDMCGESKHGDDIVPGSQRCTSCYEDLQAQAQKMLEPSTDG